MTMRDVEGAIAEAVEVGRLNGMDGLNNWQRSFFRLPKTNCCAIWGLILPTIMLRNF